MNCTKLVNIILIRRCLDTVKSFFWATLPFVGSFMWTTIHKNYTLFVVINTAKVYSSINRFNTNRK